MHFPSETTKEIVRVQKELEKKKIFEGKLTEKENLHLTLKFFGEISSKELEQFREKLRTIKFEKFSAKLGKIGVFGPSLVKIIWIEVLGKVSDLQKKIDEALKGLFRPEKRFMSHLTIARVKNVIDMNFFQKLGMTKVDPSDFEIGEFYLMKSVLGPTGPTYSVIEKFELN